MRSLYHQANYAETIQKNILLRDLFISGIASREAKCLLYQQDSDSLTLDQCVHLVSSYETSYSGKRSSSPAQIDINTMEQNDKPWSCHSCETSSNPKETSVLDVNSVDHKKPIDRGSVLVVEALSFIQDLVVLPTRSTVTNADDLDILPKFVDRSSLLTLYVQPLETAPTEPTIHISSLMGNKGRKFISAKINGKFIPSMLVDSGSEITVLSYDICKKVGLSFQGIQNAPHAIGASGAAVKLIGRIYNACIETSGNYLLDQVYVAQNLSQEGILGQSSLEAFESVTFKYGGKLPELKIQNVEQGTFVDCPPASCFPVIPENPIRSPSRRQSPEDKRLIKEELKRLVKEDKIRPSYSPWRSQAFITREEGRKATYGNRLCTNNQPSNTN